LQIRASGEIKKGHGLQIRASGEIKKGHGLQIRASKKKMSIDEKDFVICFCGCMG